MGAGVEGGEEAYLKRSGDEGFTGMQRRGAQVK